MFYLRGLEQAALIAVIVALARKGLFRSYRAFVLFLGVKGIRSLALFSLDYHDPRYGQWWALSAPFLMLAQMLAILEVMDKIMLHFAKPGKPTARLIIGSCFGLGAVLGAVSSALEFGSGKCPWYVTAAMGACKITDWVSVGAFMLMAVWLAVAPNPLCRNVRWHRWLLATYAGFAPGIALLFANVAPSQRAIGAAANWGLEIAEIGCCALWICAFSKAAELCPCAIEDAAREQGLRLLEAADLIDVVIRRVAQPITGRRDQNVVPWPTDTQQKRAGPHG